MGKPVPPRFPPARVLNDEQTAFIQSLAPSPIHSVPVPETPKQPVDQSTERLVSEATDHLVDQSTERLVSKVTDHLVDQSTHHLSTASQRRPRSRENKRQGKGLFARANGKTVRKLSFYLPVDLAKSLQMHCVASDRDMSAVVTDLVRRALAKGST